MMQAEASGVFPGAGPTGALQDREVTLRADSCPERPPLTYIENNGNETGRVYSPQCAASRKKEAIPSGSRIIGRGRRRGHGSLAPNAMTPPVTTASRNACGAQTPRPSGRTSPGRALQGAPAAVRRACTHQATPWPCATASSLKESGMRTWIVCGSGRGDGGIVGDAGTGRRPW